VVVLHFDRESGRVSLGYKQKSNDPWETVETRFAPGTKTQGRVVSLTNYGAFVELEPGVEASCTSPRCRGRVACGIPASWSTSATRSSDRARRQSRRQAHLARMKQSSRIRGRPSRSATKPGTRVSGKVRNLTDFGAFIELEPGVDGLLHISDMSWTRNVGHPSEVLKKGQTSRRRS